MHRLMKRSSHLSPNFLGLLFGTVFAWCHPHPGSLSVSPVVVFYHTLRPPLKPNTKTHYKGSRFATRIGELLMVIPPPKVSFTFSPFGCFSVFVSCFLFCFFSVFGFYFPPSYFCFKGARRTAQATSISLAFFEACSSSFGPLLRDGSCPSATPPF
jgi:hypothetical protein